MMALKNKGEANLPFYIVVALFMNETLSQWVVAKVELE